MMLSCYALRRDESARICIDTRHREKMSHDAQFFQTSQGPVFLMHAQVCHLGGSRKRRHFTLICRLAE